MKRCIFTKLIPFLFILFICNNTVNATPLDVMVMTSSASPTTNYGSLNYGNVGERVNGDTWYVYMYVPNGSKTIYLYNAGSTVSKHILVKETTSFSEGTIKWSNQPSCTGTTLTDFTASASSGWESFNIVTTTGYLCLKTDTAPESPVSKHWTDDQADSNLRPYYEDYSSAPDYNGTNSILFSNTTDYTQNLTTHPINTLLYVTTFLNNSLWESWWVRNFATLNYIVPSGESYNIGYITQQNASQYSIIPDQNGIYTFAVRCDFFCGVFDYYTIFSEDINIIYPYNEPDDLLFSHTLDYNTSITEHPLNESFYLNVWIADGSSMSESDYFGHWRINVTSPTDTYLGTYYPVRNYYQGSYPIQISMDQFNGTGKYGNYTFKMFFALSPDEMNTGEVLIKEAVINLYNSSNYNDTGYYNNITEELGNVQDGDISNYTDIPELQFLNNSFSYDTFVWIATPIHTMHIGIDSINNYYSDTNNTQHITVLGSIVPILVSNLPEKVKLLFTYQIILTIILLIMGRD